MFNSGSNSNSNSHNNNDSSIQIFFYLEKTLSQNPSDVAHLLKYLYYPIIRYDTKNWYYFVEHRWSNKEDTCPLISLMKDDLVNRYLALSNHYSKEIMRLSMKQGQSQSQTQTQEEYVPLLISDLMYKSKLSNEIAMKLSNVGYYMKVVMVAQELFTQRDFQLKFDLQPELMGFNNGNYHLDLNRLRVPVESERVFMSVGYNYRADKVSYRDEIMSFWGKLGLVDMLPMMAKLLHGNVRNPVIWVNGLNEVSTDAIVQLLNWTLGDYVGTLGFSELRKRKIPHIQNHTHVALVNNCNKRLLVVEQTQRDYPSVYQPMVDILLNKESLNLRKPYEVSNDYHPQFGIIVLSMKTDAEPLPDAMIFNVKENLQPSSSPPLDDHFLMRSVSSTDSHRSLILNKGNLDNTELMSNDNNSTDEEDDEITEESSDPVDAGEDSRKARVLKGGMMVKEEWKYEFVRILFEYLRK